MRRFIALAGLGIGCAGCALPQPAEPVISQVSTSVATDDPNCIVYTTQAEVGQTERPILGRACKQADGSWKVTEGAPGQPAQALLYYPPPDAYAGAYDPWLWGPPIGFSAGAVVFVDHDHRLHHVRDFHDFDHDHDRDRDRRHHHFGHSADGMGMHHS